MNKVVPGVIAAVVAICCVFLVAAFFNSMSKHAKRTAQRTEPVQWQAPPPAPPAISPRVHEPVWTDDVPQFSKYKPLPAPHVKKRRVRKHRPICVVPAPAPTLPYLFQ